MTIDFSAHIISVSVSCIVHVDNVKYTRSWFILQCVVVSYNMSTHDLFNVYIPVTVVYVQVATATYASFSCPLLYNVFD